MNYFFDTSALVKYFHVENGTDIVTKLIKDNASEVYVSDLARLEFASALYRRYRNNTLDELRLHSALLHFENQLKSFYVEPITQIVFEESLALLKRFGKEYGLRTLDALHLGTYNLISETGWCFVTSDSVLEEVGKQFGCLVLNPCKSSNFSIE